jgi:hypothetical protein
MAYTNAASAGQGAPALSLHSTINSAADINTRLAETLKRVTSLADVVRGQLPPQPTAAANGGAIVGGGGAIDALDRTQRDAVTLIIDINEQIERLAAGIGA